MQTADIITKTKWTIDTVNSQIGFKVKYLLFSNVRGTFRDFNANISTSGNDFTTASIHFSINPASIDTGIEQRDAHLKDADFFDVQHFKEITFSAYLFKPGIEDGHYELYGDLTMKGVEKQIQLEVESGGFIKDPWGSEKALFSISGKINRKSWGLNWNAALETGGVLVSEDVWIECEVQLIKQA